MTTLAVEKPNEVRARVRALCEQKRREDKPPYVTWQEFVGLGCGGP